MTEHPEAISIRERAKRKLERDMGPALLAALHDPRTVELMLNADGRLWQEKLGEPMQCIGAMRVAQAQAIIETVAGYHGKEVTRHKPILEGELPLDGSRFAGQLPPVVAAPTFSIRKRAIALFTLDDYVANGALTARQREVLIDAVRTHRNILVVGGTGAGKTTLLAAMLGAVEPGERIVCVEDAAELAPTHPHVVRLVARPPNVEGVGEVTVRDLVRQALRMRPDRIVVGEVRGGDVVDLTTVTQSNGGYSCGTWKRTNEHAP